MDGVYYDGNGNLLGIDADPKPGDVTEDGKEIEQDGDVTWD